MNTEDQLAALLAKILDGTMSYEDTADLFMLTTVGQSTGVSRAEVLAKLHAHFQDLKALNGYLQDAYGRFAVVAHGCA
jgi:hypothetical protein